MAAARQEDVNSAMLSILKKMDTMVTATQQTYEQSLITLGSVETIMRNDVGTELKKQTAILLSLESKLGSQASGGAGGGGNMKEFKEAFGAVADSLEKILKAAEKINDKKSQQIANFFTKLAESINKFTKEIDKDKAEAASELIAAIGGGVLKYALIFAVATPLLMIALPGTMLFGLSMRLLFMTMGQVSPDQVEAMKSVLALAKGALLYSLAMTVVAILSPIVLIGSTLFGLSIRLLLLTSGAVDKKKLQGMQAVLGLAKGALLYSLAMTAVAILSPIVLIGSVLFGLSIRLLLLTAGAVNRKQVQAMEAVLALAKGALLYSLAMVAVTLLAPIVLIGSVILGLSLRILAFGLSAMGRPQVRRGVRALMWTALGIFALGLSMWAFSKMVDLPTALFTVLTVGAMGILFWMLGKAAQTIAKGALAMVAVGIAIIFLSIGLLLFKASNFGLMDALTLTLTVAGLGIAMFIAGKFTSEIIKGSIAMIFASTAIIVLSIGLLIFKQSNFKLEDSLSLGAAIVAVGLAMGIAGAGPIPGFIMAGSIAMILASVAIIVLSTGLAIFKASGFKLVDSLALGAAIGVVGVTMAAAGLASPFIMIGSIAMILASVALLPLTGALAVFKASGWKKGTDDENLKSALGAVISGFLGGEMPGGLIASLKFAAQAAARAVLLFVTVPPMILAGLALMSISAGLMVFKKSGFNQSDAENLEFTIASIARAFTIVTDKERQKKLGININPFDLFIGIAALSNAGNVLTSLAEGVQAWANLEVSEWEVINPGTEKAKLVIKGRRKLNKSDFDNAAYGMAQVISAIAAPFAKVGKLEMGMSSGDTLYDSIFGGGYVSAGIDALARSGDTLVSLAQGVQAWAKLEITEYEVVNAGTKNAKIVPKAVRRMNPVDFALASLNMGMVIGFLANEFAKIGKMEKDSSGLFSGGYVTKGIQSISGLGDQLLTIAEVITKMANMEIVENEIKNGKIVPKSIRKMTPADFLLASINIGMITGFLAKEMAKIGEMEDNSSGWFSNGYVKKGIEAISGLGQNISSIAEAVMKMAQAEITEYEVKGGKLVPKSTRKMSPGDFLKAGINIDLIMGILIDGMSRAGAKVEANREAYDAALEAIPNMTKALSDVAKPIEAWSKLKEVDKIGKSITTFLTEVQSNFDPEKNKNLVQQDKYFTTFVKNIETMASQTDQMDRMAANFDKIQKSMKLTKDHINAMDLKKLTLTDALMRSLAAIAKNPEAMAKAVEGGIDKAFKDLAEALKQLASQQAEQNQKLMEKVADNNKPAGSTGPAGSGDPKAKGIQAEMQKNAQLGQNTFQKDMIAALTAYGAAKNR